jgi:hypothetical protein
MEVGSYESFGNMDCYCHDLLVKSCISINIICLQFCIAQKHGYLHVAFQTKNQRHSTNENITLRKQKEKVENQTMQGV